MSEISFIDSARGLVPYDRGRRVGVVALSNSGSTFASVDVHLGRTTWWTRLGRRFERIDISPDDRIAVVSNPGLATIDLRTRHVATLATADVADARITADHLLVIRTYENGIEIRDLTGTVTRKLGRYRLVLLETRSDGGAAALVKTAPGRYGILDVRSGRLVANARPWGGREGRDAAGLSPDLHRVIIDGPDGQLWTFGIGEPARPTGISVPSDLHDVLWQPGGRIVLASDSERGQVVAFPGGERLGHVCWSLPSLPFLRSGHGSDVIACGPYSAWALPSGPLATRPPGLSETTHVRGRLARLEVKGSYYRMLYHGAYGNGPTAWSAPLNSTLVAGAFSSDGHQALVGADNGGVAILGLTPKGVRVVAIWHSPDGAAVRAVGWVSGPVARTATGKTWRVPPCRACETDAGLVAAARARLSGCLTKRQLYDISSDVRKLLDLHVCAPVHRFA